MYAIEIENLKKQYANGLEALKGINLKVKQGDFFGLLGPNGAGKSTTIGILTSLVNKSSGTVKVYGHDIDEDLEEAKRMIGLVPQEFNFNIFENVIDIVMNQAGYYGVPRRQAKELAEHYIEKLGLWDKRKEMARNLSGGMKRRLLIARGMVHEPKLLILDEPTAGVDIEIRRSMWSFLQDINAQGVTIILTTHYLEEAETLCRNIGIINHGQIIEQASKRDLLAKLNRETLILDVKGSLAQIPNVQDFEFVRTDDCTLEVSFERSSALNPLFNGLSAQGIEIESLRNKSNRLEELFLGLVAEKESV